MTNPVMVVRTTSRYGGPERKWRTCWMWCPGCNHAKAIPVAGVDGTLPPDQPHWTWDGNLTTPTFDPSILQQGGPGRVQCHSYIRGGRWEFLSDCTHELAGKTVSMVPLPDWLVPKEEEVNWNE